MQTGQARACPEREHSRPEKNGKTERHAELIQYEHSQKGTAHFYKCGNSYERVQHNRFIGNNR